MLVADTLTPADVAAIARVRDSWLRAINTDDLAGMEAAATDDFVGLPPNESPLLGQTANREWHRSRIEQFTTRLAMTTEELQGGTVWAFERFSYGIDLTPRSGGASVHDRGNCLWTWQRQGDGSWKVARAIWNSDSPVVGASTETDAAAIRRVADQYTTALNGGDLDGLMATFSPDMTFLPPDAPLVSGTAAVRTWVKTQFFDLFQVHLSFAFSELDISGNRAVAYGPFQLTLTPHGGGAPIRDAGKFIDVYHRQPDSSWKFARVMFNRDAPAGSSNA